MLTILVEVIMSVFIANFKATEHPIANIVVRGILIMITIFFLGLFSSLINGKEFSIKFALMISFFCGLAASFSIFIIEIVCNLIWGNKNK